MTPDRPRTLHRQTARPDRATERGSAFVVSLLALVVLSIIGLSLALITQTEMQIGANERSIQRVFYAADAGIDESVAWALARADHRSRTFTLSEDDSPVGIDQRIAVSPFYPILDAPCNLCEINDAGTYGGSTAYRKVNHAVTADAIRVPAAGGDPLSGKQISAMVEVQPWTVPPEAYLPLNDPDELAKIKF